MSKITYQEVSGAGSLTLKVRDWSKIIGGIYKAPDGGFYYRGTNGGPSLTYARMEDVKAYVEG